MENEKERKVMVMYGGSFNPVLYSHLSFAQQVINEFRQVEKVIFVPVNSKYKKEDLASNKHRYQMLQLAIQENKHFFVSDIEVNKKEPLYTIQTLQELQKKYPQNEIWLLVGSDNLKEINTWKEAETLLRNFKVIVAERENDKLEEIVEKDDLLKKYKEQIRKVEQTIKSNSSATMVRQKIRTGESIRYLLPEKVRKYIEKNKVY